MFETEPNYLQQIRDLLARDPATPGTVGHVVVEHDDDCDVYQGRACDCDCIVRRARPDELARIERR